MTLGQLCNRIDAAKQRGEFNPLLPVAALFPELVPIHEETNAASSATPQRKSEDINERTT